MTSSIESLSTTKAKAPCIRTRLPVRLLYFEVFDRIEDAYRREKQVQGWSRAKRLALVHEQLEKLPQLSKKKFARPRPEQIE